MRLFIHILVFIGGLIVAFVFFSRLHDAQPIKLPEPPSAHAEFIAFDLAPGFSASLYATGLDGVRVLVRDPLGAIIASLTPQGKVVVVRDDDGDGESDRTITLIEGLDNPHGLAIDCDTPHVLDDPCDLYVAEVERVARYRYDLAVNTAEFIGDIAELPPVGIHFTRTLALDAEERRLFVSIGSSCGFCDEFDRRYATIQAINLSDGSLEEFATGLYNTVFMTFHPLTGDLWGTEMGREGLGDELPPDEINIIRRGNDYGWPFCYGGNVPDIELDGTHGRDPIDCHAAGKTPSTVDLLAHSAPLGIAFVPYADGWPDEYQGDLLVAYHGPASSVRGDGHRIVRIDVGPDGMPTGRAESFMVGFVDGAGNVVGRPVALLIDSNGVLFVSDDKAGSIYRVIRRSGR